MPMTGSRIIITGGASGMGAAVVRAFSAQGGQIVALDRDEARGHEIAAAATAAGPGSVTFIVTDVSDKQSVDAAFERAIATLGTVDTVIHAAGIAPASPAESIPLEDWELVFAINTRGTFLVNQAAFKYLKDKGGRIINFASGAGVNGLPNKAHYSATKGAVIAWSRTIAKEWGKYGITVNCIAPAISTPMYAKTRSEMTAEQLLSLDARLAADMPIGGALGDPDRDLVPVLRFLSTDDARFMTGQIFAVDGGLLMVR